MRYDVLVEDALRGVVSKVLQTVAEQGLNGEQHFYITFRTADSGVEVPEYLRKRYPAEMTIVLQYQFYGLEITDEYFTVTLTFNNVPERLVIPFASITVFADPSVNFGLQLKFDGESDLTSPITLDESEPNNTTTAEEAVETPPEAAEEDGANVVTLDAFRKK